MIRPYLQRMGRVPTAIHPFEKKEAIATLKSSVNLEQVLEDQVQPIAVSRLLTFTLRFFVLLSAMGVLWVLIALYQSVFL